MRKSSLFFFYLLINLVLIILMFAHASHQQTVRVASLKEMACIVERFELTDLCIFTEASYTRNLSQADLHAPFQDGPMSLEHFPSGSLATPPQVIRKIDGKVD